MSGYRSFCHVDALSYLIFSYDKGMPAGEQDSLLRVALLIVWIIEKDSFHNMMKVPCRRAGSSFQEILATVHGEVTIMIFLPDIE